MPAELEPLANITTKKTCRAFHIIAEVKQEARESELAIPLLRSIDE
jgi:hypothetical protein